MNWRLESGILAAILCALLIPFSGHAADAASGHLFGYSIGDQYPLDDTTRIAVRGTPPSRLNRIVAQAPVKPDDIGQVLLITTPVSHTILKIGVQQPFQREEAARAFAGKYLRLFSAKYPAAEADLEVIGRRGRIRFSQEYELVMTLLEGSQVKGTEEPWVIELLYQAQPDSPTAGDLSMLLDKEIDVMELRGQDTRGL